MVLRRAGESTTRCQRWVWWKKYVSPPTTIQRSAGSAARPRRAATSSNCTQCGVTMSRWVIRSAASQSRNSPPSRCTSSGTTTRHAPVSHAGNSCCTEGSKVSGAVWHSRSWGSTS
ncbi:hypothetical protein SCALM49S_10030 [Streptomyces californicus]